MSFFWSPVTVETFALLNTIFQVIIILGTCVPQQLCNPATVTFHLAKKLAGYSWGKTKIGTDLQPCYWLQ